MSPKAKGPPAKLPPKAARDRLLKADGPLLVQGLTEQGFEVHTRQSGRRIDAYNPVTREYICGFTWVPGTATQPGRWTFDCTLLDVFSGQDLKMVTQELRRITDTRQHLIQAWVEYQESQSDKRWSNYLSHLALMFITRAPKPPEEVPTNG